MLERMPEASQERRTPISAYNQVIKHYNDSINIQNDIKLKKAYNDSIYNFWYNIQKKNRMLILILLLVPYINIIILVLNTYLLLINELGIMRFNKNKSLVPDPLYHMIYEPSLCSGSDFMYYEIDKSELRNLNFVNHIEDKILKLKENREEKQVRFMAYNRSFISGYYSMTEYRPSALIHLLISAAILYVLYYYIYSSLCFSIFNLRETWEKCSLKSMF